MSAVTGITTATTAQTADSQSRIPSHTLDQGDFLKLLTTQFTSQDPMNPIDDMSFIAQMAQFTALEQAKEEFQLTQALNQEIVSLRQSLAVTQTSNLIGREVTLTLPPAEPAEDGETVEPQFLHGVVDSVQFAAGTPQIIIDNQPYDLDQIISVAQPTAETTP